MVGIDLMGLARCDKSILSEIPKGSAIGAFSNIKGFGDALPKFKVAIDLGCKRIRPILYWSDQPGHRPDGDYLTQIRREANRVGKFLAPLIGKVDCRVAGFCESPLYAGNALKVFDATMGEMPSGVVYVNSFSASLGGQALPATVNGVSIINEVHGSRSSAPRGRFDWSYDGQDCFTSHVAQDRKVFGKAETFYLYFPECSGKHDLRDKTPRDKRKFFPQSGLIRKAFKLIK